MRVAIALFATSLLLAACGGGGRTAGPPPQPPATQPTPPEPPPQQPPPQPQQPPPPPEPAPQPPSPPPRPVDVTIPSTHNVEKLVIQQYADTLLRAGEYRHVDLSFSDGSEIEGAERHTFACAGKTCTRTLPDDSTATTDVSGFLDLSRSQVRVLTYNSGEIDAWEQGDYLKYEKWSYVRKTPYDSGDATINVAPTGRLYGVWGDHGFARIQASKGRYKGIRESDNVSFDGTGGFIIPYVIGNASDEAPGGEGSATWKGPAEAVEVGTYAYQRGTATLAIADLSDPELSVSIVIKGEEIGSSNWNSIALTDNSRFDVGANGQDRLVGFFSPAFVESYGAFDTRTWLGVFGTKRKWTD